MTKRTKKFLRSLISATVAFTMVAQPATAALLTLANQPLYLSTAIPPKVMLLISKDQQLYKKAYNDYTDLDGDGALDTTYKHSISYYGYFDPFKCYTYNTGANRFDPASVSATKLCSGQWSGNFLNWAAMSRMDAIRKLLYGGLRSSDTSALTVLERSFIPSDAHAWAKYYNPDPLQPVNNPTIDKLTPFNPPTTAPTYDDDESNKLQTGYQTWNLGAAGITALRPQLGDQIRAASKSSPLTQFMVGWVTSVSSDKIDVYVNEVESVSGSGSVSGNKWTLTNLSATGISFCNVTAGSGSGSNRYSHTNTNPPLIRVAQGNYLLWSANERWQCQWSSDQKDLQKGFNGGIPASSNGNKPVLSGLAASAENPDPNRVGLGTGLNKGEYVARVQACVAGLYGTEKCKEYPTAGSVYKPIGLLQAYGEAGLIQFGLVTGSYAKNISGGVLRKNPGALADEINSTTDGTFVSPGPSAGNIITTLNKMRMYGYDYNDGTYIGADGNCTYQLTSLTEGQCTTWGNPMSEIFYEGLRYFAGKTANSAYTYSGTSADATLGLPIATWADPLTNSNYCTPLSMVAFNASVSSYDDDLRSTSGTDINSSATVRDMTNKVGAEEGINATSRFIGKTTTTPSSQSDFEMCTAKSVGSLGDVSGLCPEGPSVAGSYHIAGLAYQAKTNRIRTDLSAVKVTDTKSLKVTTYGVQLSTNTPTISIPVPGDPTRKVVIQPAYRLDVSSNGAGPFGGGAIVDVRVVAFDPVAGTGALYVNWEDSEQGGDYDQDVWGMIRWSFPSTGVIRVETDAVAASTANGQGFGYIISGTAKDGAHFHSGILGFDYTDPTSVIVKDSKTNAILNSTTGPINASGGCRDCDVINGPNYVDYALGSSAAAPMQDPLFYAAKFGGFTDTDNNNQPNLVTEWDQFKSDGSGGSDGLPDNYFLVSNPLGLEQALNRVFLRILQVSSAASVATNSTSLQTGSRIYQAQFNSNDWSGKLLEYAIDTNGNIASTPTWNAGDLMNPLLTPGFSADARKIITFTKGSTTPQGIPFRWPANPAAPSGTEITSAQVDALRKPPGGGALDPYAEGQKRLLYIRGDATNEGPGATDYRRRDTSKLGDIVNSNPNFVAPPSAGYFDAGYATFRTTYASRKSVIYVGANDGMLHAFDATPGTTAGTELLAYVPSPVYKNLSQLTSKGYNSAHKYFVDGTPEVQDVCLAYASGVCTNWRTYLVASLGQGGQGVYALDVTDPSQFSEANAASIAKWEFTDADNNGLGYIVGQPLIRRMANGKWAAIFSGGYNNNEADGYQDSNAGRAYLFIVYLTGPTGTNGAWVSGTDYIRIDTGTGLPADNALGQPFAADVDADGVIDFVYAGDLSGRLWKFDVRSTTASNWTNASNRVVLFRAFDAAGNAQPITGGVEGSAHPNGGFMINFGTGKYIEPNDINPPGPAYKTQSYYGIWDKNDGATVSVQTRYDTITSRPTTLLAQQILTNTAPNAAGEVFRVLSDNQPTWTGATPNRGWVLDFPSATPPALTPPSGERSVFPPQLINLRLIFNTLVPSTAPCDSGGTSYLMVVNNITGGQFNESIFDTDGNGIFNANDKVTYTSGGSTTTAFVSGRQSRIGISPAPTIIRFGQSGRADASGRAIAVDSGTSNAAVPEGVRMNLGKSGQGRLNWREILTD